MISDTGSKAFEPRFDNKTVIPDRGVVPYRTFREGIDAKLNRSPFPHPQDCEDAGGVTNYTFETKTDGSPYVLGVQFSEHCFVKKHYHPTGTLKNSTLLLRGRMSHFDKIYSFVCFF